MKNQKQTLSSESQPAPRPRIFFLVTEDWYFCSHRISLAETAIARGYEVHLATRVQAHGDEIRAKGIILHPLPWRRTSRNPLREASTVLQIAGLFARLKPRVVHFVAIKPVIYGNLVRFFCPHAEVISAVSGLGSSFAVPSAMSRLRKVMVEAAFRLLLRSARQWVVVQNVEDADYFKKIAVDDSSRILLIPGAGVDVVRFRSTPEPSSDHGIVISLVSRMLWSKGIADAVEAVGRLRAGGYNVTLQLVGEPDPDNSDSVPTETLVAWSQRGDAVWLGRCDDIPAIWASSHIAVLPSYYREGVPRSLLEAAACGRPIVTCDVPGCRDLVKDGVSGFVVPPQDPAALADVLGRLIKDPDLRARMGQMARQDVKAHYGDSVILKRFMDLYEMLSQGRPGAQTD